MSDAPYFLVDPESRTSWSHDWTDYLSEGETISSRIWTISTINPGSPATPILSNATSDVVFVEGMAAGHVYRLLERVTTSNGVIDDRSIVLRCDDT